MYLLQACILRPVLSLPRSATQPEREYLVTRLSVGNPPVTINSSPRSIPQLALKVQGIIVDINRINQAYKVLYLRGKPEEDSAPWPVTISVVLDSGSIPPIKNISPGVGDQQKWSRLILASATLAFTKLVLLNLMHVFSVASVVPPPQRRRPQRECSSLFSGRSGRAQDLFLCGSYISAVACPVMRKTAIIENFE